MVEVTLSSYPAPKPLEAHCVRSTTARAGSNSLGTTDPSSIRDLVKWLVENGGFETYDDWVSVGMICKIEAGDAGLDIWSLVCHNQTLDDASLAKWNSFADVSENVSAADLQKVGSLLHKAKKLGWSGNLHASAQWLFRDITGTDVFGKQVNLNPPPAPPVDPVAQIAADAGATLSSAPPGAVPLADTQRIVAALGQPILDNFLAGTRDSQSRPVNSDFPNLPEVMENHPLYEMMRDAISRIVAMAEGGPKMFRQTRVLPALAVLYAMHPTVCEHLTQRLTALGGVLSSGALDSAVKNFEWRVRVETNTAAGFILDSKGNPAPENSDNVHVFIRQRAVQMRYNAWKEQVEVAEAEGTFAQLTDHLFGDLLMDAENSQFNYHPSEGRFRRGLVSNARRNMYDPLVERLDSLARAWDGVPRLHDWLTHTCGTPRDTYHEAVGRNLIGGLVRRARHPGCEQAETVIFISPTQGTGKTTLCKILALDPAWHTDSFKFEGSAQNTIPQLAGKWLIELSEMAGLAQKDVEHVKSFLSATNDNYTKKYEAFATDHPRRCCFVGTSNSKKPLQDSSGGRRFLPVHVRGEVATEWLREHVEQIIGEAAAREAQGESFGIPRSVWDAAGLHQEAARTLSPIEELCQEWFDRPETPWGTYITSTDIGRALKMAGQLQHARYAPHLDKLGWRDALLTVPDSGRRRVWVRHTNNELTECVRLLPSQTHINGPVEMRPTGSPVLAPLAPPPY